MSSEDQSPDRAERARLISAGALARRILQLGLERPGLADPLRRWLLYWQVWLDDLFCLVGGRLNGKALLQVSLGVMDGRVGSQQTPRLCPCVPGSDSLRGLESLGPSAPAVSSSWDPPHPSHSHSLILQFPAWLSGAGGGVP